MPRRRRRMVGPRTLALILILMLLALTLSWVFGRRRVEPGGGPDPVTMKTASLDARGDVVQVLRPVVAPRSGTGRSGAPHRVERAVEPEAVAGRSWLHGRVVDSRGEPLRAEVVARRALHEGAFPGLPQTLLAETETDDDGRWILGVMPPDDVVVVIVHVGDVPHVVATLERVRPWSVVDVGESRAAPPRRFHLPGLARAVLRPVVETAFGPAPVLVGEHDLLPIGSSVADDEEIDVTVGSGSWELVVFREGALPVRIALEGEPSLPPAVVPTRRRLTVGGDDRAWVVVTMDDGAAFSMAVDATGVIGVPAGGRVRVLFAGAEPVEVSADATDIAPPARGEVVFDPIAGVEGVHFEPLVGGAALRAAIAATVPARALVFPLTPGRYNASARRTAGGLGAASVVDVRAGRRTSLVLHDGRGRRLEGNVIDAESGLACEGVAIVVGDGIDALDHADLGATAMTDAEGRFEVTGLPAGELDVVVTSPLHRSARRRVVLAEDPDATTALSVALVRGAGVAVRLLDAKGDPLSAFRVAAIDASGNVVSGESGDDGIADLGGLATGRWVVFAVLGRLAVPADAWDWLVDQSGGRVVDVGDDPVALDWVLPTPRTWEGDVVIENAPADRIALRIVHAGTAPAAGIWPDLEFDGVRAGPVRIDRLFAGRYRAIATVGDRSEIVDFELPAAGPGPRSLVFAFPEEN